MEKNQTLQVTDLQKKKQQVLEQLHGLLDGAKVEHYKEWLVVLACKLLVSAEHSDVPTKPYGGEYEVADGNIWAFWRFFDFLEHYGIDSEVMKQIIEQEKAA